MDKKIVVYAYNEILFNLKKNAVLAYATTWMKPQGCYAK